MSYIFVRTKLISTAHIPNFLSYIVYVRVRNCDISGIPHAMKTEICNTALHRPNLPHMPSLTLFSLLSATHANISWLSIYNIPRSLQMHWGNHDIVSANLKNMVKYITFQQRTNEFRSHHHTKTVRISLGEKYALKLLICNQTHERKTKNATILTRMILYTQKATSRCILLNTQTNITMYVISWNRK